MDPKESYEVRDGGVLISTDRELLDYDVLHGFLSTCYWSYGISMQQLRRQIEHSTLVFGLYRTGSGTGPAVLQAAAPVNLRASETSKPPRSGEKMEDPQASRERSPATPGEGKDGGASAASIIQIGFTRILSDYTRLAYVHDVFVVPEEQRKGLGLWMLQGVMDHPELRGVRKWALSTRDAQGVYAKLGFTNLPAPEEYMICKPAHSIWM